MVASSNQLCLNWLLEFVNCGEKVWLNFIYLLVNVFKVSRNIYIAGSIN
jgi:hypothetical protein